jgi:hypothetical protein
MNLCMRHVYIPHGYGNYIRDKGLKLGSRDQ